MRKGLPVPSMGSFSLRYLTPLAFLFVLACGGGGAPDIGAETNVVVPDANFPVTMAFAPDGRLFYNELQTGNVRIVTTDGQLLPEPFAHVEIGTLGYPPSEWGLIGLALDPDFQSNHYVYIYYTELVREVEPGEDIVSGKVVRPVVLRFTEVDDRGVDPTFILADLPETDPRFHPWHMAGNIHFGPDGNLYVTIGEMQQDELAQDLSTVHGKILRVNKQDGSAPADNPFVDEPGADSRVFAYGFRNSFDFTFHPQTGGLYAIENGNDICDELNLVVSGQNYGWPQSYQPQKDQGSCQAAPQGVQAIYNFALDGKEPWEVPSNVAPAGIEFVSADVYPTLGDSLLICEFNTGFMRRLVLEGSEQTSVVDDAIVVTDCSLDIAVSPDGIIYYSNDSEIRRLLPQ